MTEGDRVFEEKFPGKNVLEVFPMKGDETACPKCDLQFKTLLHPFCQHKHCPPRALSASREAQTMTDIDGETKMTHVFEGQPDARQSDSVSEPVSRFRPRYRALTDDEKALHDAIKAKAAELETLFETVKPGRYRSLGMTALEEAVMWTVKELTS